MMQLWAWTPPLRRSVCGTYLIGRLRFTSCSEIVTNGSESKLQEALDDLSRLASLDGFQLNEAKCKEPRIGFSNSNHDFEPLVLNGKPLEVVTSAKLLGLTISHDLKWNMHTSELIRKCSSRLYFLRQLKRSRVAPTELVQFYVTCIRPIWNTQVLYSIVLYQTTSVKIWNGSKEGLSESSILTCHIV